MKSAYLLKLLLLFAFLYTGKVEAFSLLLDEPNHQFGKRTGVYNPGDTIRTELSWESNESSLGDNYVYLTFTLPGGKVLYAADDGFSLQPRPYGSVDLAGSTHTYLTTFDYTLGEWMPQGEYTVECWLTEHNLSAWEDTSRWLSPKMTARFETTSHYIPVTYETYDRPVDYSQKLVTNGGVWIVYYHEDNSSSQSLYGVKLDPSGRTLIAPFRIGAVDKAYPKGEPSGSTFALASNEKGGLTVAGSQAYPQGSGRHRLFIYKLDPDGKLYENRTVKSDMEDKYHYFWAANIPDGVAVIARFHADGKYRLFTVGSQSVHEYILTPEYDTTTYYTFYKAYYDSTSGKLVFIYGNGGAASDDKHVFFTRYRLDGSREITQEVTSAFEDKYGAVYEGRIGWPSQLFKTDEGYAIYRPEHISDSDDSFFLLFLHANGSLAAKRPIEGLEHDTYGNNAYGLALERGEIFHLIARSGSYDFTYARFQKDGTLLIPPTSVWHQSETTKPPHIALTDNDRVFALLPYYPSSHPTRLSLLYLDYDFPSGKPDMAVSAAGVSQTPEPFAALGYETDLKVSIANRGENPSKAGELKLRYLGHNYTVSYTPLYAGESVTKTFSILQPDFLTEVPIAEGNLSETGDWQENDHFSADVYFAPLTPIYPKSSNRYTWQVIDNIDAHAIANAQVLYTLPAGTKTVSGAANDVTMSVYSGNDGQFETVLPNGDYTFTFFKYGYPHTKLPVTIGSTVTPSERTFSLQPPGDLHLVFWGSDHRALHPTPLQAEAQTAHREDSSLYEWQDYRYNGWGDENGMRIIQMMPGDYDANVTVFGYDTTAFSPIIQGSIVNDLNLTLPMKSRGRITGTLISSGNPVAGATVSVLGIGTAVTTESDGTFAIGDLPIDSTHNYHLLIHKNGYQDKTFSFKVTSEDNDLTEIAVAQLYSDTVDIDACRYAAWVQKAEWNLENNFEIQTIYGVWDLSGNIHYNQVSGENAIDIDQVDIDLTGLRWSYANLDGHVVEAFASWAGELLSEGWKVIRYLNEAIGAEEDGENLKNLLTTKDDFSDPMGTVRGAVTDCGDLDALADLAPYDPAIPVDETIARIDDLKIYDGDAMLFRLRDQGRIQYYSDKYRGETIHVPVMLNDLVSSIASLRGSIYLRVQNGEHSTGPLGFLHTDKVRIDFKYDGNKLRFDGILSDPSDYPEF